MQYFLKVIISLAIILGGVSLGKKFPTLAGLLATMPLTGLLVLIWLYLDNKQDYALLTKYTQGAIWGIIPSIIFYAVALICFKKQIPFFSLILISFFVWGIGAFVHQLILR